MIDNENDENPIDFENSDWGSIIEKSLDGNTYSVSKIGLSIC